LLTAIGIYGVLTESVARRRSEIAIRMAVGAAGTQILRLIIGSSVAIASGGITAGTIAVLCGASVLRSMVYGVSALNPIIYCSTALLLLIVAVLAAYLPARRAASVDPMNALKGN